MRELWPGFFSLLSLAAKKEGRLRRRDSATGSKKISVITKEDSSALPQNDKDKLVEITTV
jgi:hypothetical protein